jgi:hypothetical protein
VVAGRQVVVDWAMAKARFTDAQALGQLLAYAFAAQAGHLHDLWFYKPYNVNEVRQACVLTVKQGML